MISERDCFNLFFYGTAHSYPNFILQYCSMVIKHSLFHSALGWFRLVALAEGISYLFLLFIAMPLKYMAGIPQVVQYSGWVHGILFVIYGFLLLKVWTKYNWTLKKSTGAFIAALLPFGTLVLDKKLRKEVPGAEYRDM
jgi:integral membrane protein